MGGASSKSFSRNENNQTIVNKNTINILNSQVNEIIAKSLIDNSKSCQSNVDQTQLLDISNCVAGGAINITDIDFEQVAVVDFSCIQVSEISNILAQEMMNGIIGSIKSGMDVKSFNAMISKADSLAKVGFAAIGGTSAGSETVNTYNLSVTNENTKNLENIVKNSINTEFKVKDVQDCINNIQQMQITSAKNCRVGKDININNIEYEQGVELIAECLQKSNIANKITNNAMANLVEVIDADTEADVSVTQEGESKAEAKTEGFLDGVANIMNELCAPCGEIFGSSGAGFSSICCVIMCILLCLITLGMIGYLTLTPQGRGNLGSALSVVPIPQAQAASLALRR